MDNYKYISVHRDQDVLCVRLKRSRLEESEIQHFAQEIITLSQSEGGKVALSLGPETPHCLYSVFLAKLIAIRNALQKHQGRLVLVEVNPITFDVFKACQLHKEFTFLPDFPAAITFFSQVNGE